MKNYFVLCGGCLNTFFDSTILPYCSGHTCLVLLCSVKFCDLNLLGVTVEVDDVYSALIQLINDSPNLHFCKVANKNFQLTLSNAFSASSDKITVL